MTFNKQIFINNFAINNQSRVFIIAEAGVNHNGDIEIAKELIDIAKEANADAVKFQAFKTEQLILKHVEKAPYQKKETPLVTQFEMLNKLEISLDQNIELKSYAEKKGILFLTTAFDEASLNELDKLDLPAFKVASTDTTNPNFLVKIAKKNKPLLLSTGMSYLSEVEIVLNKIHTYNKNVILMQCSSNYPLSDTDVHLNVINTYKKHFDMIVGFSDHSVGIGAAPYAAAMGAKVIEKHFTLDKNLNGPDHKASLSPQELCDFVKEIRKVEKYLGSPYKIPTLAEIENRNSLQKQLVATKKIRKGDLFTLDNIDTKRTGGKGISALYCEHILGQTSQKCYDIDDIIEL